MKLNEGVSGEGNAIVDLRGLPAPGAPKEAQLVEQRLRTVVPEVSSASTAAYFGKLATQGGVVEERIAGIEIRSPSAQLEITAHRQVAVLSTHDQILDGKSGQRYVGCRFPAESAYAPMISTLARRVGERLADLGVIGRFAIDFVVSRTPDGRWDPFAVELNLRLGATTHPFHTLAQLAPGTYDAENATFTTRRGQPRYYVATDHLKAPQLRQLGRDATLALAQRKDVRFSRARGTGAVFHMLSSVNELARIGVTAIADTAQRADALFDHVQASLTTLAPDARRLRGRHALRRQLTLGLQ